MHKLKLGQNVLQMGRMQDLVPQKISLAVSKTFSHTIFTTYKLC